MPLRINTPLFCNLRAPRFRWGLNFPGIKKSARGICPWLVLVPVQGPDYAAFFVPLIFAHLSR